MMLEWHAYVGGKRAPLLDMHVWVGRDTRDEALVRAIQHELECLVKYDLLAVLRTALLKAAAAPAEEDTEAAAGSGAAEPLDAVEPIVPDTEAK